MFSVKWVVHRHEIQPVAVENSAIQDLDEVVESCQARFPEMRCKHDNTPPDGFLVFDSVGSEVRRWFGALSARQGALLRAAQRRWRNKESLSANG
jgi:hypothetical protein